MVDYLPENHKLKRPISEKN